MRRLAVKQTLYTGLMSVLCMAIVPAESAAADPGRPELKEIGRSVKMRILVDKVMQPTAKWTTEEWMVKETADTGFNVFSPRKGANDMAAVRQVTEWCRKYGLYHMPWMRGVHGTPADSALSEGKRIVWANGREQAIWSPNADELWDWLASQIVPYAELSAKDNTLIGVFLDYENYWPGKQGNLYTLSYDLIILRKFAESRNLDLPELEPEARKPWLEKQGLHEAFEAFQVAHWRERCRELRKAVDKYNPKFMFNIYPAPGTKFMLEACYPEWSTEDAPLILADPWTYGRSGRYATHKRGLAGNKQILERGMETARATGINRIYIGGIDPVVRGADAEFCGKNALMLSGLGDGYWVFYEGPVYAKDHPDYFKWFTWANRNIESKNFEAAWEPRKTEDTFAFPKLKISGESSSRTETREYPLVKMRTSNILVVSAHQGQSVRIAMETFRIGRNETELSWSVKNEDWQDLVQGNIPVPGKGTIEFAMPLDGTVMLLLETGRNACAVKSTNVPVALLASPYLGLIYGAEKLYFRPPSDVEKFTFKLRGGSGIETVKLTVYAPDGTEAATGQATEKQNNVTVPVVAKGQPKGLWSLNLGRADKGVLEDVRLTLDQKLPQVLSFFPDEVFETAP